MRQNGACTCPNNARLLELSPIAADDASLQNRSSGEKTSFEISQHISARESLWDGKQSRQSEHSGGCKRMVRSPHVVRWTWNQQAQSRQIGRCAQDTADEHYVACSAREMTPDACTCSLPALPARRHIYTLLVSAAAVLHALATYRAFNKLVTLDSTELAIAQSSDRSCTCRAMPTCSAP